MIAGLDNKQVILYNVIARIHYLGNRSYGNSGVFLEISLLMLLNRIDFTKGDV